MNLSVLLNQPNCVGFIENLFKEPLMYSQNEEEKYVLEQFKNKTNGVFLDIGAFDGKWASNTLALAERGWGGICVEGSPFSFSKLFMLHEHRSNVLLVNAIVTHSSVSSEDRIVRFWESPNSAASTINQQNYDKWKHRIQSCGHGQFKEMFIPQVYFGEILSWAKRKYDTIDFVSIDVEGGSTDLGLLFDPDMFNTSMVCIEHDGRHNELISHYSKFGFELISINAENIILARKT